MVTGSDRQSRNSAPSIGRNRFILSDAARDQAPLPGRLVVPALIRCAAGTVGMLIRGRIRLPAQHIGMRLHFADGTSAQVYRETVVERDATVDPCVLVVKFRLRAVRGWGHTLFRWESLLNTPLFVGFPGFVSKLWMAHDQHNVYRGVYEWDGPERAAFYARSLWRVLALVSAPRSIGYAVLPGLRRDELLAAPHLLDGVAPADAAQWWRSVAVV